MVVIAIILFILLSLLIDACIRKVKNFFPTRLYSIENSKNLTTSYVTGD